MRNFYNKGGPTLTKAQQTLPAELKKKILMAKSKKKKKPDEKSPMAKMVEHNGKALCKRQSSCQKKI
jgi:hypothetical protein